MSLPRSRNEWYSPPITNKTKLKAESAPDLSDMVKLVIPACAERPRTILYGANVDEVMAKYRELPEPQMNRSASLQTTVRQS